jgi:hypothetical protein
MGVMGGLISTGFVNGVKKKEWFSYPSKIEGMSAIITA